MIFPESLREVRHDRTDTAVLFLMAAGIHRERFKPTANAGAAPGGGHDLGKGIMILPSEDGSARTAEG